MITLGRITQQADADGVDADTVERDYVLTQVMPSLSHHHDSGMFQFMGGTLRRLCYFNEYRYSIDIDLKLEPGTDMQDAFGVLGEVLDATRKRVGLPHLVLVTEPKLRIEFGIEATDSRDPYGDIAIDEVFDLLASDMAVKALCAGNAGRRCVAGISPDGMSVVVWSAAGDELLLAAVAPDVQGLSLLLEEWRTVGGA